MDNICHTCALTSHNPDKATHKAEIKHNTWDATMYVCEYHMHSGHWTKVIDIKTGEVLLESNTPTYI